MQVYNEDNELTTDEFVKSVNKARLDSKNKWFVWRGVVNDKLVEIKCYNTYLQIFRVDGLNCGGLMDMKIAQFKNVLAQAV